MKICSDCCEVYFDNRRRLRCQQCKSSNLRSISNSVLREAKDAAYFGYQYRVRYSRAPKNVHYFIAADDFLIEAAIVIIKAGITSMTYDIIKKGIKRLAKAWKSKNKGKKDSQYADEFAHDGRKVVRFIKYVRQYQIEGFQSFPPDVRIRVLEEMIVHEVTDDLDAVKSIPPEQLRNKVEQLLLRSAKHVAKRTKFSNEKEKK